MGLKFAIVLGVVFASIPFFVDVATRAEFEVHTRGIVLVTGASSGIGRDACLHLAATTELTLFCTVRTAQGGEALLEASKGKVSPIILDVTKPEQIEAAVRALEATGIPFVGLVNNAGVAPNGAVELMPLAEHRALFEVNYFGVLAVTQALLPLLRASKGRVVTVGSIIGVLPASTGLSAYCASKQAIEALTDALRQELAPHKVSVSLLEPGAVVSSLIVKGRALFKTRSVENAELYDNVYGPNYAALLDEISTKAEPPSSTTTPDIVHALTSRFPQTRYKSANLNGLPSAYAARLFSLLPDRLADALAKLALYGR